MATEHEYINKIKGYQDYDSLLTLWQHMSLSLVRSRILDPPMLCAFWRSIERCKWESSMQRHFK